MDYRYACITVCASIAHLYIVTARNRKGQKREDKSAKTKR